MDFETLFGSEYPHSFLNEIKTVPEWNKNLTKNDTNQRKIKKNRKRNSRCNCEENQMQRLEKTSVQKRKKERKQKERNEEMKERKTRQEKGENIRQKKTTQLIPLMRTSGALMSA